MLIQKMLPLAAVAVLGLSACQSNSQPSQADNASAQPAAKTAAGKSSAGVGNCTLIQGDTAGAGRKVVYRCNGQAVLRSSQAQALLDSNVPISFGASGAALKAGLITRQAANRVGHTDEETCERAFINAAKKFQAVTLQHGGRRVSNFYSYYDRKPLRGGQYECEVGTFHGRVVMKGDIAR
ncbi:excinuclease [Neisseria sp. ZJ106]|uniref:Excinuclease n=1 Tax=Neisseria lisongii TaxID=2912188 RepID=A0ABY7RLA6_9NEIS|nr:excinuclease [Neisseria lisongii]MCF7521112.1 excinuclease [Neisseria lisongii]WCL72037.1 excinuclease [Neisseria lisongii]